MFLSLLIVQTNVRRVTDFKFFANILIDGVSMKEVMPEEAELPWSKAKAWATKWLDSKLKTREIIKELPSDMVTGLNDWYGKNKGYFHNTTAFDDPVLKPYLEMLKQPIFDKPIIDLIYDNSGYIKRLISALGFDGKRIQKFITNLKDAPSKAQILDILEGFKFHTNNFYHMIDAFTNIMENEGFTIGELPGHFFFDPDAFNIAYEEIPEYIKNDYISITEMLMEVNNLVDFGFGLVDAIKFYTQNMMKFSFSPLTTIIPQDAKDLKKRISEIIGLYDEMAQDKRLPDEIREYLAFGKPIVDGLRSFIEHGFSIEGLEQVISGFQMFDHYNNPDKNLMQLVPMEMVSKAGDVARYAGDPKGSVKETIKTLNYFNVQMFNGTETDDEFYNNLKEMCKDLTTAIEAFDSIVDFISGILEMTQDAFEFIKTIKTMLQALSPISGFVTFLDAIGLNGYRKDNLLGAIAEISKLLKKFGFYIPIKETAIDFFETLKGKVNDNMKMGDFYDSTSNPSGVKTFFKGVVDFVDGKSLSESFADFKLFGINPIKTLNNIKGSKDKSILGIIHCISDGSSTAPIAKNIENTINLFAKNDDVTVDQLLGAAGVDSKVYYNYINTYYHLNDGISNVISLADIKGYEFMSSLHTFSNETLETKMITAESVAQVSKSLKVNVLDPIDKKSNAGFIAGMVLLAIVIVCIAAFAGFIVYKKFYEKKGEENSPDQVEEPVNEENNSQA